MLPINGDLQRRVSHHFPQHSGLLQDLLLSVTYNNKQCCVDYIVTCDQRQRTRQASSGLFLKHACQPRLWGYNKSRLLFWSPFSFFSFSSLFLLAFLPILSSVTPLSNVTLPPPVLYISPSFTFSLLTFLSLLFISL